MRSIENAGVVDDDVEATKLRDGLLDHRFRRVRLPNVTRQAQGLTVRLIADLSRCRSRSVAVDVDQRNLRAVRRESARYLGAIAASRASDKCDLSIQQVHIIPSNAWLYFGFSSAEWSLGGRHAWPICNETLDKTRLMLRYWRPSAACSIRAAAISYQGGPNAQP